jgi:hypothetical protein
MNTLRPLRPSLPGATVVCSLAVACLATSWVAAAPRTPPPCAADGVCLPSRETWGWYQTNWRPWPGEKPFASPEEAEPDGDAVLEEEDLGDVQLPPPAREEDINPATPEGQAPAAEGGEAPASPLDVPIPGEAPFPGEPQQQPNLFDDPAGDPLDSLPGLDPFGSREADPQFLPPVRQASVQVQNAAESAPQWEELSVVAAERNYEEKPRSQEIQQPVTVGTEVVEVSEVRQLPPAPDMPLPNAPNLHGDDAPPALPPGLRRAAWQQALPSLNMASTRNEQPRVAGAAPRISLPARVKPRTDGRIAPAAAALPPSGIRLVNPAAALTPQQSEQGPQHAIYLEATDLP